MADALSIALSGLQAQTTRLATTANNIANASTSGAVQSSAPGAPASTVYKPLQVNFTTLDGGGVQANVSETPGGVSTAYDPSSSYANADGQVAVPNVDLAQESVNLIETKLLYKANLSVIKAADKMLGDLLDTIA